MNETRSLRPEEHPQLCTFLGEVFQSDYSGWTDGSTEFNPLFRRQNTPNLLVHVQDGEIVSHIGTAVRAATINGCTVTAGFLSAVATRENLRGQGLASKLFAESVRRLRSQGVDFVHVSGDRDLYQRFGSQRVTFTIRSEVPASLAASLSEPALTLRSVTMDDVPALSELYRAEPVRWLREKTDYLHSRIMSWPADTLLVSEGTTHRAYLSFAKPEGQPGGKTALLEYAGNRHCVLAALGKYAKQHRLERLIIFAPEQDREIDFLLKGHGVEGERWGGFPSVFLVCFAQFMERLRPYFAEILGQELASELVFTEDSEQCTIACQGNEQSLDRGQMVQLVFGSEAMEASPPSVKSDELRDMLALMFPIYLPWPGLNWV